MNIVFTTTVKMAFMNANKKHPATLHFTPIDKEGNELKSMGVKYPILEGKTLDDFKNSARNSVAKLGKKIQAIKVTRLTIDTSIENLEPNLVNKLESKL